jgi:pyruvate dehydrogenase E2 component (dihydrolipoyllysine-residue acetyltransferase)
MASEITALTMPKWGLTMTEGTVVGWLKGEGEGFAAGDEVLEIETTKITNTVEAEAAGVLRRIVAAAGATLPVGALLAVVAPAEVPQAEIDSFVAGFVAPAPAAEADAADTGPAPRDIDADGQRLRVLEIGDGDGVPILFVHGFGADLNTWMFNQPALAEGRRAISFDLPGHGGSTKVVDGPIDAAGFAAAVDRALAALGVERVHLVGHSMGGAIVLSFASRQSHRVASLTLIASAGLGSEINGAFIDGFVRAQRRREMQEVLALLVHDPALVGRTMVEDVLRYKRLDGVAAALAALAAEWFPDGVQRVGRVEPTAGLAMPVQVIWGREDRVIPVAHAERLAGRVPVHILDAAGHLPHMEKAGDVNRLIRRIVERA